MSGGRSRTETANAASRKASNRASNRAATTASTTTESSTIHRGLTGTRTLIGTAYLADIELRRAYHREIAPRTVAALTRILTEVFEGEDGGGRLPAGHLRAVDLGAGTGAAGAALRAHFGERIDVVAVDRYAGGAGVRALDVTLPADVKALGGGFDLIVAAHLLNELFVESTGQPVEPSPGATASASRDRGDETRLVKLAAVVRHWFDRLLAPAGTMILIEPALRETSRALLQLRDRLLAGGLRIVAPCFYQADCPALVRERDWCHDAVDAADGRRVDFSYLVVRREGGGTEREDSGRVRIVSDPLPEKGKLRLFACGVRGREAVVRLNRHASPDNEDLDRLRRGDVAHIAFESAPATAPRSGEVRIARDTRVERIEPHPEPDKASRPDGEPPVLVGS